MCLCASVCEHRDLQRLDGDFGSPGAGVTEGCELLDMGAGNWTWVLRMSNSWANHWAIFPATRIALKSCWSYITKWSADLLSSSFMVLCILKSAYTPCLPDDIIKCKWSIPVHMDNIKMSIKFTYVIKLSHCRYVQIIYKLHSNTEAKCVGRHLKSQQLGGGGRKIRSSSQHWLHGKCEAILGSTMT